MTTRGPAVGGADVEDREAACRALERAVQDAFSRSWSPEHASAVRRVCSELQGARLPFIFRTPAFVVTLDA